MHAIKFNKLKISKTLGWLTLRFRPNNLRTEWISEVTAQRTIYWEYLKSDRVRTSSRTSPGRPYPPDASHASTIDRSPKVRTLDQSVRDLVGTTPRYPLIDKPTWVLCNNTRARGSGRNCPPELTNWRRPYPLINWILNIWRLKTDYWWLKEALPPN
jgi:hypothetical protein